MFRRVLFEDWQYTLASVLFFTTAVAFVFFVVASWRMKSETAERLAHSPLEDDSAPAANPTVSHEHRA